MNRPTLSLAGLLLVAPALAFAQAQATVKPDGRFRYAFGAGASYASGNTSASSVNLSGDGVRATAHSKWQFGGRANLGRTDGATTAENLAAGTQYDQDLTADRFGFAKADFLRDKPANAWTRTSLFGGAGRHVVKTDTLSFDISAGLGCTEDRHSDAADVDGATRTRDGRAGALLAEESNHKWTPTTTVHQKLALSPALHSGAGYRGVFDAGLWVAMTSRLSLTAGLNYRYSSDPGAGLKKGDTLFVTGLSVKLD
jgi:putative salt-induced outer membrane protein YdiY